MKDILSMTWQGKKRKAACNCDLLEKFEQVSGGSFANDRMILS